MGRRSNAEAALTRRRVVDRAADLGSVEGLEAATIGRLADELGLSKGGVIGPFGSKERLQLAAVEAAVARVRREVWAPVADRPPGLDRLRALLDAWLSYLEREVFPGGCFLTAASLEFDDRPGAVRDAVAAAWTRWLELIEGEVRAAQEQGAIGSERSARQIAFELHGHVMAGNWAKQLYRDAGALAASRAAIDDLISRIQTPPA
jgi:AcrR family transcriptional regulator